MSSPLLHVSPPRRWLRQALTWTVGVTSYLVPQRLHLRSAVCFSHGGTRPNLKVNNILFLL